MDYDINRSVFASLIHRLMKRPVCFEARMHDNVEVVMLHQSEHKRFLISLLKSASELVNTQIDAQIRIRVPKGATPGEMIELVEKKTVSYRIKNDFVETELNDIKTLTIFLLEYK